MNSGTKRVKHHILAVIFSTIVLASPVSADETEETEGNSNSGVYLKASGLCVGGAIIGTVVPIIGNIVGCVVGATAGYFWWRTPSPEEETTDQVVSHS